jgi:hypothetical protein
MSTWRDVGDWIKGNAGTGAALVGSLLTGNIPGAVAAGVALVSGATGHATPDHALLALQQDPATVVRLRELALQEQDSIREHIRAMTELEMRDRQAEHEQTQQTIRSGDNAEDIVVRRTRPLQSWASLLFAFIYVGWREGNGLPISIEVLMILLTLPWAYAGLRQIGKGVDAFTAAGMTGKTKGA